LRSAIERATRGADGVEKAEFVCSILSLLVALFLEDETRRAVFPVVDLSGTEAATALRTVGDDIAVVVVVAEPPPTLDLDRPDEEIPV